MIGFVTCPPFIIVHRYEKRWPSDKTNHTCENMLYIILCVIQGVTNICFLASADIKRFGRACLFAMLLLIGPTLFYTPGVFV